MSATTRHREERPLDEFTPDSYMALLEGSLLTNGDVKGSWRTKREDKLKSEFCMVLMDRGVYDGGFNVRVPMVSASQHPCKEVHDKWHSLDWCETTKGSSNVWGQGHNAEVGEYYLVGIHEPLQQKIVMYKVGHEEMLKAHAFARPEFVMATVVANDYPVARVEETASAGKKRPRNDTDARTAATMQPQAPRGDTGSGSRDESSNDRSEPSDDRSEPSNDRSEPSNGSLPRPGNASPPPEVPEVREAVVPPAGSLPGSSGSSADAVADQGAASTPRDNTTKLVDLTLLGARLQKEKIMIQDDARLRRKPHVIRQSGIEEKMKKAKADEAAMLKAVQELRQTILKDERELQITAQCVQKCEKDEQEALAKWNEKWATQVAPFIARYEQGVKKKAEELERKTREAEKERNELERDLERLHSVKKIGDTGTPTNAR